MGSRSKFFLMTLLQAASIAIMVWCLAKCIVSDTHIFEIKRRALMPVEVNSDVCNCFSTCEVLKKPIWEAPAEGSPLPPLHAFALQREMLEYRAKNNVIVVSFTTLSFMDFLLTWSRKLTQLGVDNVLVGALDAQTLEYLFRKGVPVFMMKNAATIRDNGWGSADFHIVGRRKVDLIREIISLGFELVLCDSDMIWLRDPLPYFRLYPDADLLLSTDSVVSTVNDESLEKWWTARGSYVNIGMGIWRPSESMNKMLADWQTVLSKDARLWDQAALNNLLWKVPLSPVDSTNASSLFYTYDRSLKVGILPISVFCNGHSYYTQSLHRSFGLEPYAVHATYANSGTGGKRHRFRESKFLDDESDYYDSPGGYITLEPSLPKLLISERGERTVDAHFRLVNYQLLQIRNAFAIALSLNRTLVLPPIWCRHPGNMPGIKVPEYFICPLDYVLEVNKLVAKDSLGLRFREYSFLENPRVAHQVRNSSMHVKICATKNKSCKGQRVGDNIKLQSNLTDEQFKGALLIHRDVKVLSISFSAVNNAFGGFENKNTGGLFKKKMESLTCVWCCDQQKKAIRYDMYWKCPDYYNLLPSFVYDKSSLHSKMMKDKMNI